MRCRWRGPGLRPSRCARSSSWFRASQCQGHQHISALPRACPCPHGCSGVCTGGMSDESRIVLPVLLQGRADTGRDAFVVPSPGPGALFQHFLRRADRRPVCGDECDTGGGRCRDRADPHHSHAVRHSDASGGMGCQARGDAGRAGGRTGHDHGRGRRSRTRLPLHGPIADQTAVPDGAGGGVHSSAVGRRAAL